ncbi:amidohydrolase family protein [Dyadobacter arcticus]|uniref:TIM-barrel fold metal-dependent hydrolase n=1 Tax=Dyadobacter arcticus TaxID=1078754 RepID=A0ABX0UT57_9BACT|nr:amidohydrolase family protein [Dyadobacter arcticus]NIJ55409.1 putative TIM-barrel fold metal-dependent hydrolase [Dyadobacter arcticus]
MKIHPKHILAKSLILSFCYLAFNCTQKSGNESDDNSEATDDKSAYYTDEDFGKISKINTHVHFKVYDTTFIAQAKRDHFKLITVNVNSGYSPPIGEQQGLAVKLLKAYPNDLAYATTISVKDFNEPGWAQKTISYLDDSFEKGAIAVKIWKNVGMELKDAKGKFVMIDDPKFDPVLDFIEKSNATFIGHIGEPKNAWLPVDKMTVAGDKNYFSEHPEYHMYLHPEYPTHEYIMAARDHMLEKHPKLKFVGAHLGSLEWDTDTLAKRLDLYPNMAVDMAERITHFEFQAVTNPKKVRDFFVKYQDRLVYATDETVNEKTPIDVYSKQAHENWLEHWKFFTSSEKMKVADVEKEFNGLRLPKTVVDKIYRTNAENWFSLEKFK